MAHPVDTESSTSRGLLLEVYGITDSTPSLGVYYFLSLLLSVCLSGSPSVTLLLQIASSFLFLYGIEPFLHISSPCGTLQNFFLRNSSLWLKNIKLAYSIFQHCQYSGRREASFELLNATICPQGSKL